MSSSSPHRPQRRRLLLWLGAGSASLMLGCNRQPANTANAAQLGCVLTPQQTEGPYFVDEKMQRADLRLDPSDGLIQQGMPLALNLRILSAGPECVPVKDAMVDIWHSNAQGIYSDARDRSFDTRGKRFLRGYQRTDGQGRVQFVTIYPGWYPGRTPHIHVKVRARDSRGLLQDFTTQLYFADTLSDHVFGGGPYAGRGERKTRNDNDFIYSEGGRQLTLQPVADGQGMKASYDLGITLA